MRVKLCKSSTCGKYARARQLYLLVIPQTFLSADTIRQIFETCGPPFAYQVVTIVQSGSLSGIAFSIGEERMLPRRYFAFGSKLLVTAALLTTLASAQQTTTRVDYSKPRSHLFNFLAPYEPQTVSPASFANSPRIEQLVKDGKLMLSLDDAITLALENNLDLAIARYNLSIADTDVLRTKAGASARGVNLGVVSGTPGGTGSGSTGASGGGAGGTSAGAGGAGSGSGGIVTSTLGGGPSTPQFDPSITGTLQVEHSTTRIANPVLTGALPFSQVNSGTANFSYNQGFATGANLGVNFNNGRQATNSLFSFFNPLLTSSVRMTISQHLLQGFGVGLNMRTIRITKNNREVADISFRQQVISTVSQIQQIYWDLVNAYEDMRVKDRSLALANQLLSDTQKQVQIGTLAPIEIVRAQSEVAARNQDLIVSQTNLQLQQLFMKNAITKNLNDQTLAAAEVIPTDTMTMPSQEPVQPIQDLINDALQHRPELASSRIDLVNRDINKKAFKNALLPVVDAFAFAGTSNLAGSKNPLSTSPLVIPTTGYGDVFSGLFGGDFPDYGIGLSISIPIRNRAAQADQVRSELEYRQAEMRLQQLQNQIRIQVRNASYAVQQNRARVQAAVSAVTLANQTLDAEQKKYLLGASTNYNVLQAQRDLAQAESNLVAARAAYEKSRVDLDTSTGSTLTNLGIAISDAETGNVQAMPKVPGIVPRQDNPPNPAAAPRTNPPQSFNLTTPPVDVQAHLKE
jgi:outer membrane protein